jgi:hypothetical protein
MDFREKLIWENGLSIVNGSQIEWKTWIKFQIVETCVKTWLR